MAEAPKVLYIVVVDDEEKKGEYISLSSSSPPPSPAALFRYSRSVLQSALQLMGCKPRHAFKICRRVFEVMRIQHASNTTMRESLIPDASNGYSSKEPDDLNKDSLNQQEGPLTLENLERSNSILFDLYKRQTTVVVLREYFLNVVCGALSQYKYVGPNQRGDLVLACRIRERKESVTILLCGTSGCGKSTLSALLGGRLGITTVVSTDSIRHMKRSFVDEKENPLLWSSTYHAGEHLDPVAVAKAKARTRAKKLAGVSHSSLLGLSDRDPSANPEGGTCKPGCNFEMIGQKQMAVEGFKAQSEMVIDSLDRLITAWEDRKESVVVEGVHLSLNFVMRLMKKHPSIIPFMVYISNEDKHMERFAVRAKYMTLDPAKNKYVKYIRNIRAIQEYLCNRADKHLVPKINNTNVDRSVAAIHATVFSCLRRRNLGERLYDPTTNTVPVVDEEYRKQRAANSLSSKGMFQLIQSKGSSWHLMALLNTDGSVAKAWPVDSTHGRGNSESVSGNSNNVGSPMYGPLQIGKAEPVNLQFGSFGISAWPGHTGGTSRAGSVDESRADGTETGSRHFSSCCSSPRTSDGPFKEPKDGSSVSDSEEETASNHDGDSDDDASDLDIRDAHEEMEGSVDEDSTKSDEEYEDLLMCDGLEDGYCSDDDEPYRENKLIDVSKSANMDKLQDLDKYQQNLDLFLRANEQRWEASPCSYYSPVLLDKERSSEGRMQRRSLSDSSRLYDRSQSISTTLSNQEPMLGGGILSGAPRM